MTKPAIFHAMFRPLPLCALLLFIATSALRAHSVWIEPDGEKLVVRFAEPGEKLETSPGFLDSLSAPIAFIAGEKKPASVEAPKKSDHFLLVDGSPAQTACLETNFTVRGGRKPYFYARWQPALDREATPLLILDLVPTGRPGDVRAFFRGQPLANIAAKLLPPEGAEIEITADADGLLRFDATKPGQYLLTLAHHREPLAGFHRGVAYKETSHNCSLTWRVAAKSP